ncbi:MAG: hypothetical protein ACRD8O_24510, partial [Bryobacteraceae bacterium]
ANTIRIVPTAGGEGRDLTRTSAGGSMTWTPDGKHLIFTQGWTGSGASFWIIPIEGGKPRKLDVPLDVPGEMSIRPDGRRVAITSRGFSMELWVMENLKLN